MLTKPKPAIMATGVVGAAVMAIATLLPLTMAVTPAFAQDSEDNEKKEEKGKNKICHVPPGNPDNARVKAVGAPAAEHHEEKHDDNC